MIRGSRPDLGSAAAKALATRHMISVPAARGDAGPSLSRVTPAPVR
jgi:hypothetical protein